MKKKVVTTEKTELKMNREYYTNWYNVFENIIIGIIFLRKIYKILTQEEIRNLNKT